MTLDDGAQVDVQLDADFEVVGTESDDDEDESGGEQSGRVVSVLAGLLTACGSDAACEVTAPDPSSPDLTLP